MPDAGIPLPRNWALWLILGVGLWLTTPLWSASGHVFGGILVSDGAQGPWFYDFVARALLEGGGLDRLTDFNHPAPYARQDEIPGIGDAILAAPAAWLFDWPRQYGVAQSLAILVNGLGFAWLARTMGCRGLGVALSGILGLCCTPALKELHLARVNAAWPGVPAAALAAWLDLMDRDLRPTRFHALFRLVLAAVLGAFAAATYPPFVVMLAPVGLVLAAPRLRRAGRVEWGLALLAVALALGFLWPELEGIRDSPRVSNPECVAGTCPTEVQPGGTLRALIPLACILEGFCPKGTLAVDVDQWFRLGDAGGVRMGAGLAVGTWLLALLAPLHRKRRGIVWGCLACFGGLAFLALGPCAAWTEGRPMGAANWPMFRSFLPRIWCETAVLHDFGRFATMAALVAAPLSGLAVEAIDSRLKNRQGFMRWGGWLIAALAGTQSVAYTVGQLTLPHRWKEVPTLPTTAFLQQAPAGPVAELPFDSGLQFLSVMEAPGHRRINPFNAVDGPPASDPFLSWLYALGRGRLDESTSSKTHALRSGVRWVVFDPTRCRAPYMRESAPCSDAVALELEKVLGTPEKLEQGALAWEVGSDG